MNSEQIEGSLPRDPDNQLIELTASDRSIFLRQFTRRDVHEIFELINSSREHLSQHEDDTAQKYQTVDAVRASIENPSNPHRLRFGIRNSDGMLVGSINITPEDNDPQTGEIGYYLGASHTGKGYTVAAISTLTQFAFDSLGYTTVYGKVKEANIPSIKVLERTGFKETERKDGEVRLQRHK